MKTRFFLLVMLACLSGYAQKSIDKTHFESLIKSHNYKQLFIDAHAVRREVFGKIWQIDYYIAKASCELGRQNIAVEWFNSSLSYPNVNKDIRMFLLTQMTNCQSDQIADTTYVSDIGMPDKSLLNPANNPSASTRGKIGSIYDCNEPLQAISSLDNISTAEFESRLFDVDKGAEAIQKCRTMLSNKYHITVSGRFLLITYGNTKLNNTRITQISKRLEQTYNFYSSFYHIRPPDKLLTVYLLPDRDILQKTARLVHGINLPSVNLGYSNISDLSILGITDTEHIGTLCHELFHLMIRTDVGDVPPWMDEGIACIYETNHWKGQQLKGDINNWRVDVLRSANRCMKDKIPHLSDFLNFTWKQYDGIESNDLCRGAINYAYGKLLMLYCQEEGKLPELVTEVKNRTDNLNVADDTPFQTYVALFEKTFNNPIAVIENNFNGWLEKEYHLTLNP